MKLELDELNDQSGNEIQTVKKINNELRSVIREQHEEMSQLKEEKQFCREKPEWSISVFRNEMKRVFQNNLKDVVLRRRLEKTVFEVLDEM